MNEIIRYARNKKGDPIGCVVFKRGGSGELEIGWSMKHKSDPVFCKDRAKLIARNRVYRGSNKIVPREIKKLIEKEREFASRILW